MNLYPTKNNFLKTVPDSYLKDPPKNSYLILRQMSNISSGSGFFFCQLDPDPSIATRIRNTGRITSDSRGSTSGSGSASGNGRIRESALLFLPGGFLTGSNPLFYPYKRAFFSTYWLIRLKSDRGIKFTYPNPLFSIGS